MALSQTVNFSMFVDAFKKAGRDEQFSYRAMRELFDYIDDYMDDDETPIELDVVALCCEWSELSEEDIRDYYDATPDELQDRTTVLVVEQSDDDTYLVQEF